MPTIKSKPISSVDVVMTYGRYKGRTLGSIADNDLLYLDWLNGTVIRDNRIMLAVADICESRIHEILSLMDDKE